MISAFIAAIGNAFEVVHTKTVLTKYNMPAKTIVSLGSTLIFFVMVFVFAIFDRAPILALKPVHYLLFLGVIIVGFFYNILYYYALKRGPLCDVEPLAMMSPLLTMIIAVVIYPDERNFYVFIPALIAAVTLVLSRIRRHHLKIHKYSLAMMGFVVLISIESNLVKPLLEVISPIALYTLRIGILATMFLIFTKNNLKKVKSDAFWQTLVIALVVAVEYPAYYYAIQKFGVVETSLVMLLAPVLILFSSWALFKEKLTTKKVVSSAVILVCIAVATLL